MARAGQGLIRFGAAFEDLRFAAFGTQGQEVGGAEEEHGLQGVLARAGATLCERGRCERGRSVLPQRTKGQVLCRAALLPAISVARESGKMDLDRNPSIPPLSSNLARSFSR